MNLPEYWNLDNKDAAFGVILNQTEFLKYFTSQNVRVVLLMLLRKLWNLRILLYFSCEKKSIFVILEKRKAYFGAGNL